MMVCDDCQPKHGKPEPAYPRYEHCDFCGIKRACDGDKPEPVPIRWGRYDR